MRAIDLLLSKLLDTETCRDDRVADHENVVRFLSVAIENLECFKVNLKNLNNLVKALNYVN